MALGGARMVRAFWEVVQLIILLAECSKSGHCFLPCLEKDEESQFQ